MTSNTKPVRSVLLGLKQSVLDDTIAALQDDFPAPDFEFIPALGITAMKAALEKEEIDHVFIGAGLDPSIRVEATKTVLDTSIVTQVHLKNFSGGPQGYTPFIRTILSGVQLRMQKSSTSSS